MMNETKQLRIEMAKLERKYEDSVHRWRCEEQEVATAKTFTSNLQIRLQEMTERCRVANKRLGEVEKKRQAAEKQVAKFREESTRLRGIILERANTQAVSDDNVVTSFANLNTSIQKLVRSRWYYSLNVSPTNWDCREGPAMVEFYTQWAKLSIYDRALRMRAKIFEVLFANILSKNCFGLEGLEDHQRPGTRARRGGPPVSVEHCLEHVEHEFKERGCKWKHRRLETAGVRLLTHRDIYHIQLTMTRSKTGES